MAGRRLEPRRAAGPSRQGLAAAALLLALSFGLVGLLLPLRHSVMAAPGSTAVYDSHGLLLRLTLSTDEKYRLIEPLSAYPPGFLEAVLLKEDRLFFVHPGVNPLSVVKAAWHSLIRGDYRVGGSTITMQLARLAGGYDSSRPLPKLRQMAEALGLELALTKDEILAAYCSRVPCGGNIEGFGAASLAYFHKPLERLSLSERLLLASLPQRPSSLGGAAGLALLLESRGRLFTAWLARHPEDGPARLEFSMPVELEPSLPFRAPHAVDSLLAAHPGQARIDATLDYGLELKLERLVSGYVERKAPSGIKNATALLVDTEGMRVLAEVGSANFFDASLDGQVDGTRAKRSPGSALKPFLYALAIDQGLIHPLSVLKDSPLHFSGYNPDNFDNDFEGPLTAKEALLRSRNVPAVQLMQEVRKPDLRDFLASAGVEDLRDRDWYGLSLILGTAEVTSKELAVLYGALANGGRVAGLLDAEGRRPAAPAGAVLSPEAAWLVLDMLKDKTRPPESAAILAPGSQVICAWKTGTSIGFRDAWSVGVFGHYVLAVWVGDFAGASNPAFVGLSAAAPLMFDIIDALAASGLDCRPGAWARRPASLVRAEVCASSGGIPTPLCPRRLSTWFIPGKSPIVTCRVHQEVFVDLRTGLRRAHFEEGRTRREVMEIWPSDLMELFARAGLPRRAPPAFAPGEAESEGEAGSGPEIISPLAKGRYIAYGSADGGAQGSAEGSAQGGAGGGAEMPLLANIPSDSERVFWFIGDSFIGSAPRGKAFFWKLEPGDHLLRAVDDRGRASTLNFSVMAGSP